MCKGEARRRGRVEGVAAGFQHRHAAAVASQWVAATTPKVPAISGRVVNGFGLMFFIDDLGADGEASINHSLRGQPTRGRSLFGRSAG